MTQVVTERDDLDDLAAAWDDLWAATPRPRATLHRAWATTWWDHFATAGAPAVRSSLHVVVVRDGDAVTALCPWQEVRLPGPGRAAGRMLVGLGQEDGDDGGVLLGADRVRGAAAAADAVEAELDVPGTVVNLTRLRPDDPLLAALEARPDVALHREQAEDHPLLDLHDDPEPERTVAKLLKRNDVRRRWRRLGEAHDAAFVPHLPVADGGLDAFLTLHDRRWASREDQPSGTFVSPAGRRFLADAAAALDEAGLLRLSFVTADGAPVVGRFGVRVGDRYDGLKSGWDPAFAEFGPGHMGVGKVLEHEVAHDLRLFDFMRGAGEHKAAWATSVEEVGYWTATRPGRRGELARRLARGFLSLRYRARHRRRGAAS